MIISNEKIIYLTFDGSPNPPGTTNILDSLEYYGVLGTFFMEGKCLAEDKTDIPERILEAGHSIGNHSYSHRDFSELSLDECIQEIEKTEKIIYKRLKLRTKLFRPPNGTLPAEVREYCDQRGIVVSIWTHSLRDFDASPDEVVKRMAALPEVSPIVIVLHDYLPSNGDVLMRAIPLLQARNFNFASLGMNNRTE